MKNNEKKPVMVEMFSGIGSQAKALKKLNLSYDIHILDWDISAFYAYDIIHNYKQKEEFSKDNNLSHNELVEFLASKNLSTNGKHPVSKKYLASWKTDALKKVYTAYNRTNNLGNIKHVEYNDLPDDIELLTYSFPCQDLSIGSAWHGNMTGIDREANNRSGMLWHVERLLLDFKKYDKALPKFLLMENVYNINSERHKHNFNEWKQELYNLGYYNKDFTLNSIDYGIPQSRKRTFMLSVLSKDYD
nr:DNA cytosine methyltransferase [Mucispirillum sp.]